MSMSMIFDVSGQVFGRLTAIEPVRIGKLLKWRCVCVCGREYFGRSTALRHGTVRSCGCLRPDVITKHGERGNRTREYSIWRNMCNRCNDPRHKSYHNYGGRGIVIAERWRTYANFLADMGRTPSATHSLDRIDNSGNYEPGNCRWATAKEQAANRRPARTSQH